MSTNPFDPSVWFKAYDPEAMMRAFTPQAMMGMMQPKSPAAVDWDEIARANQKNFEAIAKANKAAAEAFNDILEKQMEIFNRVMTAARQQYEWADDATTSPEKIREKTAALNSAVEDALTLMKKLADDTRQANEDAFSKVRDQVAEATQEMKK